MKVIAEFIVMINVIAAAVIYVSSTRTEDPAIQTKFLLVGIFLMCTAICFQGYRK